jgi:hypothetical protein
MRATRLARKTGAALLFVASAAPFPLVASQMADAHDAMQHQLADARAGHRRAAPDHASTKADGSARRLPVHDR